MLLGGKLGRVDGVLSGQRPICVCRRKLGSLLGVWAEELAALGGTGFSGLEKVGVVSLWVVVASLVGFGVSKLGRKSL